MNVNKHKCVIFFFFFFSVPDVEEILTEADVKLDSVRQKIGQIAEELKGEDLHQFHRAFTPGMTTNTYDGQPTCHVTK